MKILSWNVNGIRAITKRNFFDDLKIMDPDILCIQETKADQKQVAEVMDHNNEYQVFANAAEKPGYSGTAVLSKISPLNVSKGIGISHHDKEGRVLCLEFEDYFLVNVYVPNSGAELKRLDYRQEWDTAFYAYLKDLENSKPVIVCGDFNVAHKGIDLARPAANYNKTAGYTQEEIDGMTRFTSGGLSDTFRHFYPDVTGQYTWWSYRAGARNKNIGWRIDYFLVSKNFLPFVKKAFILNDVMGSDHCPVGIEL
jgi:exodeoxyribonuclease-3